MIKAYAKINLTLDITGKREDGYHIIDSVMQTVSLCDKVSVKRARDISVSCEGLEEADNIAFKAARAFFGYTKINGGAAVKIKKAIPVSAGLGGGSADAAAVLKHLDKLYRTNLSSEEMIIIAASVGADVPFLLCGGTARVTGIGENIKALLPLKKHYLLLIKEKRKQSTAQSYKLFDEKGTPAPKTDAFCKALQNGEPWYSLVGNDFLSIDGQASLINEISATKPLAVSLTGSGPTLFAIYKTKKAASAAAKELKTPGRTVILTETV